MLLLVRWLAFLCSNFSPRPSKRRMFFPLSCRFSLILGLVWLLGSAWLSAWMLKIITVMLHLFGIVREGASLLVDKTIGVKQCDTTSFQNKAGTFTSRSRTEDLLLRACQFVKCIARFLANLGCPAVCLWFGLFVSVFRLTIHSYHTHMTQPTYLFCCHV